MGDQLTDEQISEYKDVFIMLDKNQDGLISIQELGDFMKSLGQNPTNTELHDMIHVEVGGGSGGDASINLAQFLTLMARRRERTDDEELIQAFKVFDRNGDGFITASELRQAMNAFGTGLTEKEADEMIREADADGDGTINYAEFAVMIMKHGT